MPGRVLLAPGALGGCFAGLLTLFVACSGNTSASWSGDSGTDATEQDGGADAPATDAAPDAATSAGDTSSPEGSAGDAAHEGSATDATPDAPEFDEALPSILGEPDTTSDLPIQYGLFGPTHAFIVGSKLLVSDSEDDRVLVWNALPTGAGVPPDIALGQQALSSVAQNGNLAGPTASTVHYPAGLWSDGTRLFVVDSYDNRVLVWNAFPAQSGQAADFALGQPAGAANLTSSAANNGGVSGASLSSPEDVWSDGTQLYVADSGNNRVLVWSTIPSSPAPAAFALGQPDLTSVTGGSGLGQMTSPGAVHSVGTTLYVADAGRLLVWSAIPTAGVAATFAIDGTAWSPAGQLGYAAQMAHAGSRFLVASEPQQLLVWNTNPTAANQAPDLVLPGPYRGDGGVDCSNTTTVCSPAGVATDGTRLLVVDGNFDRVLGWNAIPTSSTTPADFAIGQPTGPSNLATHASGHGFVSGATFDVPTSTCSDATRLFVADTSNNRVLVWNSIPTSDGAPADFALGQPAGATNLTSFQPNTGGVSGATLSLPMQAVSDGTHLFVVDSGNSRVLVWNTIPTAPVAADFALGQPNLTTSYAGTGAGGMDYPTSVDSDGTRLFVAESIANNRVLVWNGIPTSSVPADVVVGQPDFTSFAAGTSQTALAGPSWAHSDGTKLYVADTGNSRVLVWNSIPTANGAPASSVIGQPNFTSNMPNQGYLPLSATLLQYPSHVTTIGTHLLITDSSNSRTLIQ